MLQGLLAFARHPRSVQALKTGAKNAVSPKYLFPALAGEAIGKDIAQATGIPEPVIDAMQLAAPFNQLGSGFRAIKPFISSEAIAKIGADRIADYAGDLFGTKSSNRLPNGESARDPRQVEAWLYGSEPPRREDININARGKVAIPPNFSNQVLPNRELNNDFTNLYNTLLTPIEQQGFNAWLKTLPANQRSMRDYDLQGYYKFARNGVDPKEFYLNHDNPETHFNDYFKKPNHSTFSVYSKYNGQDGWQGSRWYPLNKEETKWMLSVNPTNTRSPRGLARYMQEAESGNVFSDPRGQYSTVQYPLVTPNPDNIF